MGLRLHCLRQSVRAQSGDDDPTSRPCRWLRTCSNRPLAFRSLSGRRSTSYTRPMPLERVALIPTCAECEAVWLPADEARWQAWLTEDEPPELVFYCLECAEREFGGEKAV